MWFSHFSLFGLILGVIFFFLFHCYLFLFLGNVVFYLMFSLFFFFPCCCFVFSEKLCSFHSFYIDFSSLDTLKKMSLSSLFFLSWFCLGFPFVRIKRHILIFTFPFALHFLHFEICKKMGISFLDVFVFVVFIFSFPFCLVFFFQSKRKVDLHLSFCLFFFLTFFSLKNFGHSFLQ